MTVWKVNAEMKLKLKNFDGKVIWENASLVKLPANSSNVYFDVNKNEYEYSYRKDLDKLVLITELVKDGEVLSKNSFYFKPFKYKYVT